MRNFIFAGTFQLKDEFNTQLPLKDYFKNTH